jgi:hypothetical protein
MAITNAQQARQMYKEGSEKPVTQAGVKNFLGKQEMVKAPKFWLSEPGHVKAKLAYITDEEEKILIDKNLYGSLKGKPNKGPAGLPSLQGGGFGSEDAGTGDSQGGGDKGNTGKGRDLDFQQRGMTKGDYATGRGANRGGDRDQNFGGRQNFAQRAFSGIKDYITSGGMIGAIGRGLTNFSNKFGKTTAANLADRYGYGPDYQGTIGPSSVDDDDDDNGGGGGIPLYVQLGFPSQAAYLASLQRAQSAPTPAPTTTQDPFIAYRFMAEGGIADTEVARQNYFVGGIIKKATKAVKKIGSKVNRTRKKLLKNPYVQTAIALYAPYAAAGSGFMAGASPFMRQAVISGLTTGGLQLASGQDLDAKGILKSAALSGALATMAPAQGAQATSTGAQKAATVDYSDMSKFNELGLGGSGGAANIQGGIPSANVFDYESAAYGIKPLETSKFTDMVNAQFLEKVDPKVVDAISKTDPEKLSKFAEIAKKIDDSKIGGALLGDGKGGISALKAIGIASALPLLGVGAPEEEDEGEPYRGEGIDIAAIRRDPYSYTAPRFMAEGGDVEPVAKKTMPLLDLDGKEMDLRAEGGFVPIGRMEKADDVPARLSKNEFVFTAEAVRNAGDGDIDKGAEVMYNMMKNLEAGGDVSEESQGLDGARNMFQTSQRLGEVI